MVKAQVENSNMLVRLQKMLSVLDEQNPPLPKKSSKEFTKAF